MLPANLTAADFKKYPPEARAVATAHLGLLRQLPLAFLPSLLRELIEYDEAFPAERAQLQRDLGYLAGLSAQEVAACFAEFAPICLSPAQQSFDWVDQPLAFTEQLSAFLWSTHQMEAFRQAATAYGDRMHQAVPPEPPAMPRLGIAVVGQGVHAYDGQLFRHLRAHGTLFNNIRPENGLQDLLAIVAERAAASPIPYAHWYVDGGSVAAHSPALTCVSYAACAPIREALLSRINAEAAEPGMGPERLRNDLARITPADLNMRGDPLMNRFQLKLLTEGSGTQIFSTTFAQWTAREVLRRACPLTLLVRFAPRQRQRLMSDLLSVSATPVELDPLGSLIDADMAAYYQWINQQRLTGAAASSFLVWFEDHKEALVVSPSLPRGVHSTSDTDLKALVALATG